jgi:hypothetical protein
MSYIAWPRDNRVKARDRYLPTLNTMERPLSTDTKSAIGGTRMSEAATPAVAAGNRVSTTRIVGGAGVALAASVVVQNAVFFLALERPPTAILLVRSSPTTPRTGAPWPSPWVWRP